MDQIRTILYELRKKVNQAIEKLDIEDKSKDLKLLRARINHPNFWQETDNLVAQEESKRLSDLENIVSPWLTLKSTLDELNEFAEIADEEMIEDLSNKLKNADKSYNELRKELRYSGEHDSSNLILNIQSGAGGNDAQDWAQMLQRMYIRWAEQNGLKVSLLSESLGEESGLKSASMTLDGKYAYGKLKGEHGVHRLVRLSPFNSAGSRETSFAMVEVIPQIEKPEEIEIADTDLRVDVYRAGGHGGQSVNTTDSAVRLTHIPSGTVVSIQNERSQIQNKETALKILKARLVKLSEEQHNEKIDELKGQNQEAAWGNQIRSYVLHPYTMVKDTRTNYSSTDVQNVLDGNLDGLIDAYLENSLE